MSEHKEPTGERRDKRGWTSEELAALSGRKHKETLCYLEPTGRDNVGILCARLGAPCIPRYLLVSQADDRDLNGDGDESMLYDRPSAQAIEDDTLDNWERPEPGETAYWVRVRIFRLKHWWRPDTQHPNPAWKHQLVEAWGFGITPQGGSAGGKQS